MCKKCPYSEIFWSVFSRIRTEYREILRIPPYSGRMWENTDQKTPNTDTFHGVSYLKLNQKIKLKFAGNCLYFNQLLQPQGHSITCNLGSLLFETQILEAPKSFAFEDICI